MKTIELLCCKRCGYEWIPRKIEPPRQCPQCHSWLWNTERTLDIAPERMAARHEEKEAARKGPAIDRRARSDRDRRTGVARKPQARSRGNRVAARDRKKAKTR